MNNEYVEEKVEPLKYFSMELANQLLDTKTTIDEVKGIATIYGKRDGKYLSFIIEQRDYEEIHLESPGKLKRKSDYKEEVKRLYQNGFKQKEIAARLNMSQSFVSRLLNND
mgnify:CR=1 FL=1